MSEALVLLLFGLIAVMIIFASRPPKTNYEEKLFQGITYFRRVHATPRPIVIHIVEIDLTAPGIGILVTPPVGNCALDICAMTTGAFLKKYGLQVAINGSFFEPYSSQNFTVSDYYPHTNDPVNVLGVSISNGALYSENDARFANLCFTQTRAQITQAACPAGTMQALAGHEMMVEKGAVIDRSYDDGGLNPRTAVAVDNDGKKLWLIVIDGRQDGYSEGVTMQELAAGIVSELGAEAALNLDGGGSSTLAVAKHGIFTLNSPIHTKIPMRQRPVANHLGIYALPLKQP